jgi:hypothetical protein
VSSRPAPYALLRPCRQRPSSRRTIQQRHELPPSHAGHGRSLPRGLTRGARSLPDHSMTSSARASSDGGTFRPSAFAVRKLIANRNLVGCRTGNSAGFAPLRIRPMMLNRNTQQSNRAGVIPESTLRVRCQILNQSCALGRPKSFCNTICQYPTSSEVRPWPNRALKSQSRHATLRHVLRAKSEAGLGREPVNRAARPANDRCWVKGGNVQDEQAFSTLPSVADRCADIQCRAA